MRLLTIANPPVRAVVPYNRERAELMNPFSRADWMQQCANLRHPCFGAVRTTCPASWTTSTVNDRSGRRQVQGPAPGRAIGSDPAPSPAARPFVSRAWFWSVS